MSGSMWHDVGRSVVLSVVPAGQNDRGLTDSRHRVPRLRGTYHQNRGCEVNNEQVDIREFDPLVSRQSPRESGRLCWKKTCMA